MKKSQVKRVSLTDKQVCMKVWEYDMEPTAERSLVLLYSARERGMKVESMDRDSVNDLLLLCGWRAHSLSR